MRSRPHKTAGIYYLVPGTVTFLIVDAIGCPSRLEGSARYGKSAEKWRSLLCNIFEGWIYSSGENLGRVGVTGVRINFPGGARKVARASVNAGIFLL